VKLRDSFDWSFLLSSRYHLFGLAFQALAYSGADLALKPWTQGQGAILTLHHVRPWQERAFAPNRMLEVTPEFLELVITRARQAGFIFVDLDEALDRLKVQGGPRFLCLTFDDGYRDNLDYALPILARHKVPATAFITPGFVERSAPLWWVDLEEAIRRAKSVELDLGKGNVVLSCEGDSAKSEAFRRIYAFLRAGPENRLREVIAGLARTHGVDSAAIAGELCLDWDGVLQLAAEPLVTIGAHTVSHPMLAKHDVATVCREMDQSRIVLESKLERSVRHISYPVGDPGSAGQREFELARELGFRIGVTTRPGMLFGDHVRHPTALPRLSLNGNFQSARLLDVLLAGLPSLLWNRGRRISVA
jgi:peptidoglycan/xylan/chitin deacetylase (PgdA/CDA1 family)